MAAVLHCAEIAKFVVDRAGPISPSTRNPIRSQGRRRSCSGIEVQESQHLYLVNAWEAPENHTIAPASNVEGARGEHSVDASASNLEYHIHVHFSEEPYTALSAPLTEIVLWTLKEGSPRAKVEELLTDLMTVVNGIPTSAGMHKAGWGPVLENEKQFVVLIGWENMEAFQTAVKNSPEGRAILDQLDQHTDRLLRHVILEHDDL
ncbi:hypothetical protein PHLCEN_2v2154 [Hermanssonia centrifuga]|uniref:ABM domain-containing protein n=1 Tax=Hermanssonia centrifuga TaxID=98765 RepID=A0A2R6RPW6_9APHY|nr:hypothetical protein PHLCEN_2v2154 [Hermanssonia centrifuga]